MIGKDWKKLASLLGFTKDIDTINSENDSLFDKALVVLTKWEKKFMEKATIKRLIQILQRIEREDVVSKVKTTEE